MSRLSQGSTKREVYERDSANRCACCGRRKEGPFIFHETCQKGVINRNRLIGPVLEAVAPSTFTTSLMKFYAERRFLTPKQWACLTDKKFWKEDALVDLYDLIHADSE